jgi:Zn finger protein HypA/HybF involved in hydrogenase expression
MEDVRFDHELTSFPLIGQHAVVGCESCHLSSQFKEAKSDCYSCHKEDDVHKLGLGTDCDRCHNPNDWLIWEFDHDNTDFKLKDAHQEIHCHTCHYKPMEEEDDRNQYQCADCHLIDDVHSGNFGPDCGKCHSQKNFREVQMDKIFNSQ